MNVKEDIRLKAFRQLKKEIRGSKEHLIVGIDIAKEKHIAFFGTATGKTLLKSAREPDHGRGGHLRTSGGTMQGLSLNFTTWIRDDW